MFMQPEKITILHTIIFVLILKVCVYQSNELNSGIILISHLFVIRIFMFS